MNTTRFSDADQKMLLTIARESIAHGLQHGKPLALKNDSLPATLLEKAACFVTLELHGDLRGCIGSLEARRPLAFDVAQNAYSAAFSDPRFAPLQLHEFSELHLHLSVLTAPEPLHVTSEADLLRQLRPSIDGLIIEEGPHRATFLPAVWEDLTDARDFLLHLKRKAGFAPDYWSDQIKVSRYTAESIS